MTVSPLVDSGLAIPVFSPGDDLIACLNKEMAFLTIVASLRNATWYKDKAMLAKAQEAGKILDEEQLVFLLDPGVPDGQDVSTIIPNNASFQTEDLDTYDSDCDDISNEKAVIMANISNYGSDVISEVPHSETYLNDMENQMHKLTKPQSFYDNIHKQALGYQNPFYLKKAQRIKPTLYDGIVISNKHVAKRVIGDEETLILEDIMSQDVLLTVMNSISLIDEYVNVEIKRNESCDKCFNLEAELLKSHNAHNDLSKSMAKSILENERLCNEINHVKQVFKEQYDSIKKTRVRTKEPCDSLIDKLNLKSAKNEDLKAHIQDKVFVITSLKNDLRKIKRKEIVDIAAQKPYANIIVSGMFKLDLVLLAPKLLQNKEAHIDYLKYTQEQADILWGIVEQAKAKQPIDNALDFAWNCSQLMNFVSKFLGTVRFRNDHIARIMGYGNYQLGNVTISRVYYVEGLGHNLFSVGQFCDADLEVAFRKHTCFIRNLEGVDLISGSLGINLYIISLDDMLKTSPICLLSKASKTKSWLWHRRLSHLNFSTLNKLAKDCFARGIPRLKFQKDQLCSACALGKSKKSSHQPKAEGPNQEKLYLLYMDLCVPMRVASINGKRYILVIVDDYSGFTWVKFLKSKDEAPEAIIKCIKNIQVRLNGTVRNVRTDNETGFVNQTLHEFYKKISGLVPNPILQPPCILPNRDDWDHLFQPMFDEYLNPLTIVVSPVPVVAAPRAVDLADSLMCSGSNTLHTESRKRLTTEKSKLDEDLQEKLVDATLYRGMIGSLMYLTSSYPTLLMQSTYVPAYADSDHARCQDTSSTSGSAQFLSNKLVSWSSEKQKSTAISSTEAEYISLCGCCTQILWMRSQLTDYGFQFNKILLYYDNKNVENRIVELYFVRTEYQLPDIFTKPLPREKFNFLIEKLGMTCMSLKTLKRLAEETDE
nr:retrovirus-related Pol polyprotein from transposon TNT 1-94 [Tanacetum cinerariifolium]